MPNGTVAVPPGCSSAAGAFSVSAMAGSPTTSVVGSDCCLVADVATSVMTDVPGLACAEAWICSEPPAQPTIGVAV